MNLFMLTDLANATYLYLSLAGKSRFMLNISGEWQYATTNTYNSPKTPLSMAIILVFNK